MHLRSHSSQSNNSDQTDSRNQPTAIYTTSSSNGTSASSTSGGTTTTTTTSSSTSSSSGPTSAYSAAALISTLDPQLLSEKTKLARKIREYNRKTTPVHHIHIKSSVSYSYVQSCLGLFFLGAFHRYVNLTQS